MTFTNQCPAGVAALAALLACGTVASTLAVMTLAWPGTALDEIWGVNPEGHTELADLDHAGRLIMSVVSAGCAAAAFGTWSGRRWGYLLAIALLVANLCGALAEATFGGWLETLVGVPIVVGILAYLRLSTTRAYVQGRSPRQLNG